MIFTNISCLQGQGKAANEGIVLVAAFCFVVYQLNCIIFALSGIIFPILLVFVHASLRCRNTKSKVNVYLHSFSVRLVGVDQIVFKENHIVSPIKKHFQVMNVAETFGLKKKTPMGFFLDGLGVEPEMYVCRKKSM